MTVQEFVNQATKALDKVGIETARLDCLVLLGDMLGVTKAHLLAHPETTLSYNQYRELNKKITRRQHHEPLAYIRGGVEFYGRWFNIIEGVLVPRPESETMIDLLKQLLFHIPPRLVPLRIADIGTGSGCLGITAALEIPSVSAVELCDNDPVALGCAIQNSKYHHVYTNTHYHQSDLLSDIISSNYYDIVLANLPYVPDMYPLNRAAQHEPKKALFAGPDGLDAYRRFWPMLQTFETAPQYVLIEALPDQHHALAQLARNCGYLLKQRQDFIQVFERA